MRKNNSRPAGRTVSLYFTIYTIWTGCKMLSCVYARARPSRKWSRDPGGFDRIFLCFHSAEHDLCFLLFPFFLDFSVSNTISTHVLFFCFFLFLVALGTLRSLIHSAEERSFTGVQSRRAIWTQLCARSFDLAGIRGSAGVLGQCYFPRSTHPSLLLTFALFAAAGRWVAAGSRDRFAYKFWDVSAIQVV